MKVQVSRSSKKLNEVQTPKGTDVFHLLIYVFVCLFVCVFVYLFVCLFVYLFTYLFICLFVCLFISFIYLCYSFIYIWKPALSLRMIKSVVNATKTTTAAYSHYISQGGSTVGETCGGIGGGFTLMSRLNREYRACMDRLCNAEPEWRYLRNTQSGWRDWRSTQSEWTDW